MTSKDLDKIEVVKDDITNIKIDAIVNSAAPNLLGGGSTDARIAKVAGPKLREECKTLNGCMVGHAKITKGYDLPASRVIHTVGPIYIDGNHSENMLLAMCYKNCLKLLDLNEFDSIAFPAICCGEFGFPLEGAVDVAVDTVLAELVKYPKIKRVVFCCFTDAVFEAYSKKINNLKGEVDNG